jgi:type IV/VI secretion system ImpK/VasF family protein
VRAARDLAAFVAAFAAGDAGRELSSTALRNQILAMLDRITKADDLAELRPDEVDECRFALVVWVDEVVLRSNWAGRAEWAAEPLQLRLYRTARGGNEFFEHLQRLRPDQMRAREIYLLVLTLGFQGQYLDQPAERRALIAHQYDTLRAARLVLESDREPMLSPGAYELEIDLPPRGGGQLVRTLVGLAIGLVIVYGAGWVALWFLAANVPLPRGM